MISRECEVATAAIEAVEMPADAAAEQLEEMINHFASQGWDYVRLESVSTIVTNPGNAGCAGFGAVPATSAETIVYMVVFRK